MKHRKWMLTTRSLLNRNLYCMKKNKLWLMYKKSADVLPPLLFVHELSWIL